MITAALITLAVLWFAALHRYPTFFIPRDSSRFATTTNQDGENWIEVLPDAPHHHQVAEMQEAY